MPTTEFPLAAIGEFLLYPTKLLFQSEGGKVFFKIRLNNCQTFIAEKLLF